MEPVVGNEPQRNTEDTVRSNSLASDTSSLDSSKQSVQLPTIRYPAAPLLVDRQRNAYLPGVSGVEYTFTQLQVAHTTFRYPPTPPVEIGEGTERLLHTQQQQQGCEAPALSHMSYTANGEVAASEKNTFHPLPTPPDLVPISEIPTTHCNPGQSCTQEANHMYYRKWSTDDVNQSPPCLPALPHHHHQPLAWGSDPSMSGLQHPAMQQGLKSQMQSVLFSLPPAAHSYGEGVYNYHSIQYSSLPACSFKQKLIKTTVNNAFLIYCCK